MNERINVGMITRGIREFVSRDWTVARRSKDAYWAERVDRLGSIEGFRMSDQLRRQALLQNAEWPDAALRHEDLTSHIRLAELLRRADPASRR